MRKLDRDRVSREDFIARLESIQRGSRLVAVIRNGSVEIQSVRARGPVAVEEPDAANERQLRECAGPPVQNPVTLHLRSIAGTEAERGRLFERLMKADLRADPLYQDRFSSVCLWSE